MKREVILSLPADASTDTGQARVWKINVEQTDPSPYNSVDEFSRLRPSLGPGNIETIKEPVALSDILSVHNSDGMRDISQMQTMINKVRHGQLVLHSSGLPNTRLVLAPNGKWLLFDGHHTTLAYMVADKHWLHQLPYLTITNNGQPLDSTVISYFFPPENREEVAMDWQNYAVNWQAKPGHQMEKRVSQTMGELFAQLQNSK